MNMDTQEKVSTYRRLKIILVLTDLEAIGRHFVELKSPLALVVNKSKVVDS
jgi:hypothetical protein